MVKSDPPRSLFGRDGLGNSFGVVLVGEVVVIVLLLDAVAFFLIAYFLPIFLRCCWSSSVFETRRSEFEKKTGHLTSFLFHVCPFFGPKRGMGLDRNNPISSKDAARFRHSGGCCCCCCCDEEEELMLS